MSDQSDSKIDPQDGDGGTFGSGVLLEILDNLLEFLDYSRSFICIALKLISYMFILYSNVIQLSEPPTLRYAAL